MRRTFAALWAGAGVVNEARWSYPSNDDDDDATTSRIPFSKMDRGRTTEEGGGRRGDDGEYACSAAGQPAHNLIEAGWTRH